MTNSIKNRIRIFIFDHHTLFRAGIRLIIEKQPQMLVVGEAGNLDEGLGELAKSQPDIILLELNLAGQTDVSIVPSIIKACGKSRIILVTGTSDCQVFQSVVEKGVMGIVFKNQFPEILIKAIEKVNAGEVWLERSMIASVISRLSHNHQPVVIDTAMEGISQISEREKEVIRLLCQGFKNRKIAAQLCISETTVRHHLTSIYSKLGVADRLELLIFAHRHGLIKPINP